MPSEPSLVLLRASRNWLPLLGHSYMPIIITVMRVFVWKCGYKLPRFVWFLCGCSAFWTEILCFWRATASVRAFLGWNLLFAQHFSEGFLTFRTVEKSDFQFHSFSFSIWTPSHFPTFSLFRNFCSTFWTFSHSIFLQHS